MFKSKFLCNLVRVTSFTNKLKLFSSIAVHKGTWGREGRSERGNMRERERKEGLEGVSEEWKMK